ncbi:MAG: efflux RND transporter permease subunit [Chitinophagaceae bacterium]
MIQKLLKRPVLATVISLLICVIGILGYITVPVEQFPDIAPPMVNVTASYPGADAQTVLRQVVIPLEEQINGVEGMDYMVSSADNNGNVNIKIYFNLSVNSDIAQVQVQNRIASATSQLPSEVTQYGVACKKMINNQLIIAALYSTNPSFDDAFVQNYARINVEPELERLKGVGMINVFSTGTYAMRIWLDPAKLAAYNLIPSDVIAAIQEQNVNSAPGQFGLRGQQEFQYVLIYQGKFSFPEEYQNIVVKASDNGSIIRIKDIARVELGVFDYSSSNKANGYPGVGFAVMQLPNSNAREVVNLLKDKLYELSQSFPPGLHYTIVNDANRFLDASIDKVKTTFIEAFLLVFLVVFVFLQNWRTTLIPIISSLVAIIGTFFFLEIFGFSLNMLTLFALVLAIGIVVDDAIVVVEATHAQLEEHPSISVYDATSKAMQEITPAIISITLVMASVFIPVSFMSGPTGVFYRQFGLTLATAIFLSAVNALTLSPVLCTLFIKKHHIENRQKKNLINRFHDNFDRVFNASIQKYKRVLIIVTRYKWIPIAMIIGFGVGSYFLIKSTPTAFVPNEDQGIIFGDITMPPGTSLERTQKVMNEVDSVVGSTPLFMNRMSVSGFTILTGGSGSSHGLIVGSLIPWKQRGDTSVTDVISMLYQKTAFIKEGRVLFFSPPPIRGFGSSDGFELQLKDKTGNDIATFFGVLTEFMNTLMNRKEIDFATTSFNIRFPGYQFDVQVDKCKMSGIPISDVFSALQVFYGGVMASDFSRFTKYSRVMVQADAKDRINLSSLSKIMLRNSQGKMLPITTVLTFKKVNIPESMTRFNLFTAATITGKPKAGFSTGDAIAIINKESRILPIGYDIEFSGMTREEIKSGNSAMYIFVLCFVFVYLILCGLYESYLLPFSVMLSLTIGIAGVYLFVKMFGITNNIYVQISLIMLIGLLAKNGILIVEFARHRREQGMNIVKAAISGGTARLRPILMTSFAFIFGMLPLVLEKGVGHGGNNAIGVAAIGGMLIGTLFGVFIIPTMYIIFEVFDERSKSKHKNKKSIFQ